MSLQLPASQRLKKPAQFQSVYKSKQWGGSKHFTFNALGKSSLSDVNQTAPVIGVTVSKKVSKKAVDRNRIKREIREFFRHHQTDLNDADVVITAKPSCNKVSAQERNESLNELWIKVVKWHAWHHRQLLKKDAS